MTTFGERLQGLVTLTQSGTVPLGSYSTDDTRSVTPSVGAQIVAPTSSTNNFWDFIGEQAKTVNVTGLINRYVDGKITKELNNDGVPLYTTYGNPNDQPGGSLLHDVTAKKEATKNYLLIGGGVLVAAVVLYLIVRK